MIDLSNVYYGIISATMTIIGLVTGMANTTDSKKTILIAIVTLGISDTLADAFGIFMSEKIDNLDDKSNNKALKAGISVVLSKFIIALSFFIIFYLIEELSLSKNIAIIWSYIIIIIFCYYLSILRKENKIYNISKYTSIITLIVICSNYASKLIQNIKI